MTDKKKSREKNITTPNDRIVLNKEYLGKFPKLRRITITTNIESLDNDAFENCKDLRKVYFVYGSKIAVIPQNTFFNCQKLASINLPSGLITIAKDAFSFCLSLKEIVIPYTVKIIHQDAFSSWKKDQSIIVFKDYETLKSIPAKVIKENSDIEDEYRINKDGINRYFAVTCKCGHVGRDMFIPITFAIMSKDKKQASSIASKMPRVKKNHKFRIIDNKEIDYQTYIKLKTENLNDPYLRINTTSEQKKIKDIIEPRLKKEDRRTRARKHSDASKRLYAGKDLIRKPKKYSRNHPEINL